MSIPTGMTGPLPPRSKPYAIGFEVRRDKKMIRAHTIRFESFDVAEDATEFTILHAGTDDPRIELLIKHIKANSAPDTHP